MLGRPRHLHRRSARTGSQRSGAPPARATQIRSRSAGGIGHGENRVTWSDRRNCAATFTSVPDRDLATQRNPDVTRDQRGSAHLTFRGTSDARSTVDRDTRLRIILPAAQAARLWQLLGDQLTDEEKAADATT